LKTVGNFQTEDPNRLSEQLDRFQDNVENETADIRASFITDLTQKRFTATPTVASTLLPGQIALCESALGNVTVVLAPGSKPGWLAIVKKVAANNVVARASGTKPTGNRTVNAAATKNYAAVGLFWLYFDGTDWWG